MGNTKSEFEMQADAWAEKHGVTLEVKFLGHYTYFTSDQETRDVYEVSIRRGAKSYTFRFGQSLANSGLTAQSVGKYWDGVQRELNRVRYEFVRYTTAKRKAEKRTAPTMYDVMAVAQKYPVGSFAEFCGDYGYDTDSRSAMDTYLKVQEEYDNLLRVLGSEALEDAQEIS